MPASFSPPFLKCIKMNAYLHLQGYVTILFEEYPCTYCLVNTVLTLDYLLWVLDFDSRVGYINMILRQTLQFSEANILLNYISSAWILTTKQCKWIPHALTMAKRVMLQHQKD